MIPNERNVVKSGTWIYDGSVLCTVKIIRAQILPGSGDYEDPPEERDDRDAEHYRPVYCGPNGDESLGGYFFSLQDCVASVESLIAVEWN